MEKSKVYFSNFRAKPGMNIQQKLTRLIKTAGISNIDFDKKYVAIKIHFGEPGNLAYLCQNCCRYHKRIRRKAIFNRLQHIICRRKKKCT